MLSRYVSYKINLIGFIQIFVGLGFPYEGPAPLEAIADGAVFLNPIFRKGSALYNDAAKFFTVLFIFCRSF